MDITFFESPFDLHKWLEENFDKATELQIGFHKVHAKKTTATYAEALDEALCFGWIDGVRRRIDEDSFTIRFSPRKPGSIWSNVNVKRVNELMAMGRMKPSGIAAFEKRKQAKEGIYAYEQKDQELGGEFKKKFMENKEAWAFFQKQPAWYQRTASWLIISAKREETRWKKLDELIRESAEGRTIKTLTRNPAKK
jgi:uncharacterized protein YdeI (YjbR/CyaY-like superfamily)